MTDDKLIRLSDAIAAVEENRAFGPAAKRLIISALRALPATLAEIKSSEAALNKGESHDPL